MGDAGIRRIRRDGPGPCLRHSVRAPFALWIRRSAGDVVPLLLLLRPLGIRELLLARDRLLLRLPCRRNWAQGIGDRRDRNSADSHLMRSSRLVVAIFFI